MKLQENFFSAKMKLKADTDLLAIIEDEQGYVKEARQAALWELESRSKLPRGFEYIEILDHEDQKLQSINVNIVPQKVKLGASFIYISLLIGILKYLFIGKELNLNYFSNFYFLAAVVVMVLFFTGMAYLVSKGINWARIVILVFFAVGMALLLAGIKQDFMLSVTIGIISVLQATTQLYTLFLLFHEESNVWFKKKRENGN